MLHIITNIYFDYAQNNFEEVIMKFRPGETAPHSGQYKMFDENGEVINIVDLQKGQTFPPTPSSSCYFEEV